MIFRSLSFKLVIFFVLLSSIKITLGQNLTFAVIGDFGMGNQAESDVANLVKSWNPDFIITVGDNNYPDGEASTIDRNIGYDYHQYIKPYTGSYGTGSTDINRFWPVTGNHDWHATNLQPYLDYFNLPNNEFYYNIKIGDIEFFMIDSDTDTPDGYSYNSDQGNWMKQKIQNSTAKWKIAVFHHAAYSSDSNHGNTSYMQWPFEEWGINAALSGHAHTYERIMKDANNDGDSLAYFVNGLGGANRYSFGTPVSGSIVRYNSDWGAMKVSETQNGLLFQFFTRNGNLIDSHLISEAVVNGIDGSSLINGYKLYQNYPNPFNPTTNIEYTLPKTSFINLKVFDVLGREVTTLVNDTKEAGKYTAKFDGSNLSSGIYICQLKADNFIESKKFVLMK